MKSREQKNEAYLLSSVNNSLKIIELLMVRDDIRLKEIAQLLNLDRTSVFKMLYTLERRGFVMKGPHACYRIGNKLAACRQLSVYRQKIADIAAPYILRLWASTKKTIMLGVMGTDDRILIVSWKAEKDQDSIVGRIGAGMDNHTSSIGKILLANMPTEVRDAIIQRSGLERHTENTITDPEEFRKCLEACREKEWVVTYEENHPDHCDIAVPIFDYSNTCVASLCIVTDRTSMDSFLPLYRSELLETAFHISEQLGYRTYIKE